MIIYYYYLEHSVMWLHEIHRAASMKTSKHSNTEFDTDTHTYTHTHHLEGQHVSSYELPVATPTSTPT